MSSVKWIFPTIILEYLRNVLNFKVPVFLKWTIGNCIWGILLSLIVFQQHTHTNTNTLYLVGWCPCWYDQLLDDCRILSLLLQFEIITSIEFIWTKLLKMCSCWYQSDFNIEYQSWEPKHCEKAWSKWRSAMFELFIMKFGLAWDILWGTRLRLSSRISISLSVYLYFYLCMYKHMFTSY